MNNAKYFAEHTHRIEDSVFTRRQFLSRCGMGFGALSLALSISSAVAAQPTPAERDFFENKIRPILAHDCYKCHSQQAEKVKGGLLLDSREGVLKGGNTGPAVIPFNPDKSLLIQAVRYTNEDLQMPPKGEKLSAAQVADLVTWVKMGAPDPRAGPISGIAKIASGKDHWAFQPVKRPSAPEVKEKEWIKTPVDAFILSKLEENGMKPSPAADKRALIRRATFDLIGLPPTPAEVKDFLDDTSADAFGAVVDRLLASPHYGERWGRYWLDTARYADTKGERKQKKEDFRYPFAWGYRDYVIRSFNQDKPFNIFVTEQIAADRLPATQDQARLTALGFLTLGNHFNDNNNDIINDRIDVVTKGFLGLTVTCARCHDHKFDPIPTKDYYSLRGIFASCTEPELDPVVSKIEYTPDFVDYQKQITALETEKKTVEAELKALRGKGGKIQETRKQLQNKDKQFASKIASLELTHPGAPMRAPVLVDRPKPADSAVFIRGEAENKGEIAPRRFLEVLSGPVRQPFRNGSGRLELAQAIASKNNQLTARVIVNRIWLHHFGEGFVTTPDDFGTQSVPPSHPELLDYLASRFMDENWSIKKLHRLIMLSSVYQQSSANNPRYAQADPNNRLLWRANIRRLEFEALRDSLLAIGGKLDLTMWGKPVDLSTEPYSTRRTIYGFINRNNLAEVLNYFDFANPDFSTGKRYETTVPQQALFLMNSPLVVEQARNLVSRPDFQSLTDEASRIQMLYELIYQRLPETAEIKLGFEFMAEEPSSERVAPTLITPAALRKNQKQQPPAKAQARRAGGRKNFIERDPLTGWEEYAHALLQANEASFVN